MQHKQFSALLLQDNVVPTHKVEEAFQRQVLFGGRLGTNLLEIGAINEETLLKYLAQATHLPWADREMLTEIDWAAVELLTPETARALNVLPVRFDGETIKAIVTDPLKAPVRAQLKEHFPHHIQQFITSEFRFYALLNKLHNTKLDKRFRLLSERFPVELSPEAEKVEVDENWELMTTNFGVRQKSSGRRRQPSGIRVGVEASEPQQAVAVHVPVILGEERSQRAPRIEEMAPDPGMSYDAFVRAARSSTNRDEVLSSFVQFAATVTRRCLLVLVSGSRLRGYMAAGAHAETIDPPTMSVRVRDGGDIAQVCNGASYYQGPVDVPELQAIYNQAGVVTPLEAVVLPVQVGPRVVMIAIADNEQHKLGDDMSVLFRAVYHVAEALERLLLEFKKKEKPTFSKSREPTQKHGIQLKAAGRRRPADPDNEKRRGSAMLGGARMPSAAGNDPSQATIDKPDSAAFPDISSSVMSLDSSEVAALAAEDAMRGLPDDESVVPFVSPEDSAMALRSEESAFGPRLPQLDGGATGIEITVTVPDEPEHEFGDTVSQRLKPSSTSMGSPSHRADESTAAARLDPTRPPSHQMISAPTPLPPSDESDVAKAGFASVAHSSIFVQPADATMDDDELQMIDDIEPLPSEEQFVSHADAPIELSSSAFEALPPEIPDVPVDDVSFWVAQLDARDRSVSERAVEVMSVPNPDAVDALMQQFPGRLRVDRFHHDRDMPPADRHSRVLACLVPQGLPAERRLLKRLTATSADERFYALLVLAEIGSEEVLSRLWNRIFDKDPQIRQIALRLLKANTEHPMYDEVLEMLVDATHDDDERILTLALRALGELRNFEYIEVVLPLLEHENPRIGEVARQTLGAIALDDPGPTVRKWEKWLSAEEPRSREDRIADAMVHRDRHVRAFAADELAEYPGLMLNYHPDAHRRERMRAREDFIQWIEAHPGPESRQEVSGTGNTTDLGRLSE